MDKISSLREKIDVIDDCISKDLIERTKIVKMIAEEKKQSGIPVGDGNREREIVYRITKEVPEDARLFIKQVYGDIFEYSKACQSSLIDSPSKTVIKILETIKTPLESMPSRSAVACQGVEGSYSQSATNKLFPINDITYFKTFEGVFSAVQSGMCEYGVLPIENSLAGSVGEVYDLMKKYNFYIISSIKVKVEHCLAIVKSANVKEIKKVISHPQALMQCSKYVKEHNYQTEDAENTATSAKKLSISGDTQTGVICSPQCAEIYGLKIVERAIQNDQNNYTRFICIGKNMQILSGSDKISIMTSLPHKPGSLNSVLNKFSLLGLNLVKIESRPIAGTDFDFMFYFDFEGNVHSKQVLGLLSQLENSTNYFQLLGCYKQL